MIPSWMRSGVLSLIGGLVCGGLLAQAPVIAWQRLLGGTGWDVAHYMLPLPDGGFVELGSTSSEDGGVVGYHPGPDFPETSDIWVVRMGATGEMLWNRALGGSENEQPVRVITTADGGFLVLGQTRSNDGDVSGHHGGDDLWVVRLDAGGELLWQRTLGGSLEDTFQPDGSLSLGEIAIETPDAGFVLLARTKSMDGDVIGHHGGHPDTTDVWLVKLDADGELLWQRCLGGSFDERSQGMLRTASGSFIIAAYTYSSDGDVSGYHGMRDLWLVSVDADGAVEWQRTFGGSGMEQVADLAQLPGGDLLLLGSTASQNGDVGDPLGPSNTHDAWLLRVTEAGELVWERCYGGSGSDAGRFLQVRPDGNMLLTLQGLSTDGDLGGGPAYATIWNLAIDPDGEVLWATGIGPGSTPVSNLREPAYMDDGGCVMGFSVIGATGTVTQTYGVQDAWVVRIGGDGALQWQSNFGGSSNDGLNHLCTLSDGRIAFGGFTVSTDHDLLGSPPTNNDLPLWVVVLGDVSTGIGPIGSAGPVILQDPQHRLVRIQWPGRSMMEVDLFDLQGRALRRERTSGPEAMIDLNGLPSAAVVLQVRSGEAVHRCALIVP